MSPSVRHIRHIGMLLAISTPVVGCAADDPDPVSAVDATVTVFATGCRNTSGRGIGTHIEPGAILTSAHTLAGADTITVTDIDGASTTASLLAFDPEMDLALLSTDPSTAPVGLGADPPTTEEAAGLTGTVVVERAGRFVTLPVTVARRVMITTEDIHREGETRRPGYELIADIEPGDSGALLIVDGHGIGVVWSRSTRTDGRAWAIDVIRAGTTIRDHLANGIPDTIDLDRC